jgi:hypothetical protein
LVQHHNKLAARVEDWRSGADSGALRSFELRENSGDDFIGGNGFHASEIDGTLSKETGTAFDLMPDYVMPGSHGTSEARFGRAKDRDHGNADQGGEMHCAGIVRQ